MGKPQPYPKLTQIQADRFWIKVDQRGANDCWPWIAKAKGPNGQGKFRAEGKTLQAPRLAWELTNGPLDLSLKVYQTCGEPLCCNPAHLAAGSQSELQAFLHRLKHGPPKDRRAAQRAQDPQTGATVYPTLMPQDTRRFWSKVHRLGADDCWRWTGATHRYGHGAFRVAGRTLGAHRIALELIVGPIGTDKVVRHTCDNPACCNPAHLILGTQVDNMQDCKRRGRGNHARGERASKAKLTEGNVREIRRRIAAGELQAIIAADYNVHPSSIGDIRLGKTWSWLE